MSREITLDEASVFVSSLGLSVEKTERGGWKLFRPQGVLGKSRFGVELKVVHAYDLDTIVTRALDFHERTPQMGVGEQTRVGALS